MSAAPRKSSLLATGSLACSHLGTSISIFVTPYTVLLMNSSKAHRFDSQGRYEECTRDMKMQSRSVIKKKNALMRHQLRKAGCKRFSRFYRHFPAGRASKLWNLQLILPWMRSICSTSPCSVHLLPYLWRLSSDFVCCSNQFSLVSHVFLPKLKAIKANSL